MLKLQNKITNHSELNFLSLLFFVSGFSALIYQVVWQRLLFTLFGIAMDSITIIVSLFMLGLGVGALLGGYLSYLYQKKLTSLFCIIEGIIGVFGFLSVDLIYWFANHFFFPSASLTILIGYSVLVWPIIGMGATLPILIERFHKLDSNFKNIATPLYFMNTLGAASACFMTVGCFLGLFGLKKTILIAVCLNFFVSLSVFLYTRKRVPPCLIP